MYRLRPLTMLPRTAWADRPTTMPLMPPAHPQQLLESYLRLHPFSSHTSVGGKGVAFSLLTGRPHRTEVKRAQTSKGCESVLGSYQQSAEAPD